MNDKFEVLKATGDAEMIDYTVAFKTLKIRIKLYDEKEWVILAEGIEGLQDTVTHEVDAFVHIPELDIGNLKGYGIVDTENNITLQFKAESVQI